MKENRIRSFFNVAGACSILMLGFASCAQTDILSEQLETSDELTLNLTAPESLLTRADTNHKLRFTAKLFSGEYGKGSSGIKFLQMKQGVATNGENCTITFSVPEGEYQILLFADYIPNESQPDSKGIYPDKYYDTTEETENVTMIAFFEGKTNISQNNFNNDNFDCFSGKTEVINKTEAKYETSITLKRCASKIRFISTTNATSQVSKITFSKFDYGYQHAIYTDRDFTNVSFDHSLGLSNHSINGMSNASNNELFYFYSLSGSKTSTKNLGDITFTITFADGTTRKVEIPAGKIKYDRNNITTVRGTFLADENNGEDPGDNPGGDIDKGDIILHLDSDPVWNNDDIVVNL